MAPLYLWNRGIEFLFLFKQREKTCKSFFRKLLLLVLLQMWSTRSYTLPLEACAQVCVCVCVCVGGRETHREKAMWSLLHGCPFRSKSSEESDIYTCHLRDKGQREITQQRKAGVVQRESCRFARLKWHKRWNVLLVAICCTEAAGIFCCCTVWLCSTFPVFRWTYRRHLQDCESVNWLINLKMKAAHFFETSGTNYPTRRRRKKQGVIT